MKLRKLLNEGKYDVSKQNMKIWFEECIKKYFSEYKDRIGTEFFYPTFEIKTDQKRAGWFKSSFIGDKPITPVIGLNPDFIEHTAKNIVFHETIHYIQANTYGYTKYKLASNGGHDSFFIEKMNKINSIEGKDFITIKQETQSLANKSTSKTFWVYGILTHDGTFAFAHSSKTNDNIEQHLIKQKNAGKYKKVYKFQTNIFKYKIGSVNKTGLKFNIPVEQPTEYELQKYEI